MERVCITADQDGLTKGIQLAISVESADGGHGYRLCGPKYSGTGKTLKKHFLSTDDARTIYEYIKPLLNEEE